MEEKPLILDGLDGYQFEELTAKIMKKKGYEKIKVTPKSRDGGKDITMENSKGETILVECKHQKFVGRPIIQKLQGAINHEENQNPSKQVKGIIVTSGKFSQEAKDYNKEIGNDIELIDGKELKELCKKLDLVILNGKVQIITNKSLKNKSEKEVKELVLKEFSNIYWNKQHKPLIKTDSKFIPTVFIDSHIGFSTNTSIGCVDNYSNSSKIAIEGTTGKILEKEPIDFFFSSDLDTEEIKENEESKKIPFEFTENDIEEHVLNSIIEEHTHEVNYIGGNNRNYSKTCIPKKRDIDIKQFLPVYIPVWTSEIDIMKMNYKQKFYVNEDKQFYLIDELKVCKICKEEEDNYKDMTICPECGRIVCKQHMKIDYLDEETPICEIHAKPMKLWLQTKYFAKKENLKKYKEIWESKNFFQKLYEDKIAFGLSIGGSILFLFILFSVLSFHPNPLQLILNMIE